MYKIDNIDYQIAQRYRGYDGNNDGRVGRSEWSGDTRLFLRLDANRDGYITLLEYARGSGYTLDALGAQLRFSISTRTMTAGSRNRWNEQRRLPPSRHQRDTTGSAARFEEPKEAATTNTRRHSSIRSTRATTDG
jgi:hypothetical protein